MTITGIWNKFGTEHKYHTINTLEWPNSHKLKIQESGGRHLQFRKNVNNFGLDTDILHQIIWEDAPRPCGDDHLTKIRNRKLIRETSSNERLCVLISVTIADIWTKFYIELKYHHTINMTECSKCTRLENPRWWRPLSLISENVNNSELDRAIGAKFGRADASRPCVDGRQHMTKTRNWNFFMWRHCCDE